MRKNAEIKLFVFDWDGTALGGHLPYDQFPKPFAAFLDALDRQGIGWATNTTWAVESQHAVIERSRVKSDPAFLSGGTGLFLATLRRGRLTHDARYEAKILKCQKAFHARQWPSIREHFQILLKRGLVDSLSYNFFPPQCMLSFTCKPRNGKKVLSVMAPLLDSGDYYTSQELTGSVAGATLIPHFMNKRGVIATMQERLRLTAENTLVAGDGINDLPMFDPGIARWAVCPENADPRVKDAVRAMGGIVATKRYSWGVMEGARKILRGLNPPGKRP